MDRRVPTAVWTALAAAVIPCLPFLPMLLSGQTLWFRDFHLYFVPMKSLLVDLVRDGQLPLWDPYLRNGLPLLANPQTGVFYPPTFLLVLAGVNPGLTLFLLLHLALAGCGFHLFLREARFLPLAALFGAVAFGLGGYVASLLNVLNNLQAAVWLPWVLFLSLRLRAHPTRTGWVGLVLAAALALLGGELQLAALGLGTALGLVLLVGGPVGNEYARRPLGSGRARTVALAFLAFLTATGLVAVQLIPTAELLRESVRQLGLPLEFAAADSFEPQALFSLAFPRPAMPGDAVSGPTVTSDMPWLLSAYLGGAAVLLAGVGLRGPRRDWTAFWCLAAFLGALLALGSHSPVFRWAYEWVPPFRVVRYPEKFLLLPAIALPALAAAGVERLLQGAVRLRDLAVGLGAVALSAAGSLFWEHDPVLLGPRAAAVQALLVVGGAAVVLTRAAAGKLAPKPAALLLCAVCATDLALAARAVNPTVPWSFYGRPWAARVLARDEADPRTYRVRSTPLEADMEQVALVGRARFFSNHYLFQQGLVPNLGEMYGVLQQDGGAGIETRGTAELIDALIAQDPARAVRMLRLLSVRYLVTALPPPSGELVRVVTHPELPLTVYRVPGALPRAYLAARWRVVAEPRAALERALADDFDADREAIVDRPPAALAPPAGPPADLRPVGKVLAADWQPSRIALRVEAARPALLVVTDSYYPGWRASLDGREVPLLRANGYGRAVAVPPGRHVVSMRYLPVSLLLGGAVTVVALTLLAALALAGRWRRRPQGDSAAGPGEASPSTAGRSGRELTPAAGARQ